ncbi:unnamed protein product [Sphagnum tenellum]
MPFCIVANQRAAELEEVLAVQSGQVGAHLVQQRVSAEREGVCQRVDGPQAIDNQGLHLVEIGGSDLQGGRDIRRQRSQVVRDGQEARIHARQCGLVTLEVREARANRAEEDFRRHKALPESDVQNDVGQLERQVNVELVGQNLSQ